MKSHFKAMQKVTSDQKKSVGILPLASMGEGSRPQRAILLAFNF